MRAGDMRPKSVDQLGDQLEELKREQFNLRFQAAQGSLENTSRAREVRREIARVKTVLREKRAAQNS